LKEFLPILQAQAASGQWEAAQKVTRKAVQFISGAQPMMCDIGDLFDLPPNDPLLNEMRGELHCEQVLAGAGVVIYVKTFCFSI
jgi:hypothetical protein